jgi:hypothetical protein
MKESMKFNNFTIFILGLFLIFSCKKNDSDNTPDIGKDYFPIKVGSYIIYDVDSSFYDDFYIPTKVTTTQFQLKEKIQSIYYDNQNRPTARLERYIRTTSNMAWNLKNVWSMNITSTTAERVEENVRFIKLVFPVKAKQIWNTNNQNTLEERILKYTSVDEPETIGNLSFNAVATTEYDDGGEILTNREYNSEKFAKNIGLVYRKEIHIESQPNSSATAEELQLFYATPIMDRITSGYQYSWTINSYGVE